MALAHSSLRLAVTNELTDRALPSVAVVIPTRNRCELLEETLTSIRRQTYQSWIAIVADDGSTDGTVDMVQKHCDEDDRIRWMPRLKDETPGASFGRNLGLSNASTEYIIFLDSDDLLMPECLERRIEIIRKHPDVDFVVFQAEAFKDFPGDLRVPFNTSKDALDLDRFLRLDHPWQTTGPIWRTGSLRRIGGWDPSLLSWQDWELNIRAICRGLKYAKVESCDYYFRRNPSPNRTNSKQRNDRSHLKAAITLFGKVAAELQQSGNLTVERRQALLGLSFLVVMRLNWDHSFGLGLESWRHAYEARLVPLFDYLLGALVLASLKPPLVRKISWRTLLKFYRYKIGWKRKYMI